MIFVHESRLITWTLDTVRLGMLTKYGYTLFAKIAKDETQDIGVRKKARRVLAILGINGTIIPNRIY